jgi:fucose 4-O-acetylase-like acetyltransferase
MVDQPMTAIGTMSPSSDAAENRVDRIEWVDGARGIGIILVVIGHALGGMLSANQFSSDGYGQSIFSVIYTFHMPLFFLLSGLFIVPRVNKGPGRLIKASLWAIVLPYFLWGALQSVVIAMASSLVTAPVPLSGMLLVQMLWSPPSQFWFLYALFFMQVFAALVLPTVGAGRFLILAIVARLSLEFIEQPNIVDIVMRNCLFFALGAWLGPNAVKSIASFRPRAELVVVTGLVFLVFAYDCVRSGGEYAALAAFPAAVSGIAFTVFLALRLPDALRPAMIYLGRRSMPIYLLHVFVVAGTRILFVRILDIDEPILIMALAILLGLALPLVADWMAKRVGVGRAVGFA